jgi:hypothetical protein
MVAEDMRMNYGVCFWVFVFSLTLKRKKKTKLI